MAVVLAVGNLTGQRAAAPTSSGRLRQTCQQFLKGRQLHRFDKVLVEPGIDRPLPFRRLAKTRQRHEKYLVAET
jgi:hypothetical protein